MAHRAVVVAEVLEDALRLELEHTGLDLAHQVTMGNRARLHGIPNHFQFKGAFCKAAKVGNKGVKVRYQ